MLAIDKFLRVAPDPSKPQISNKKKNKSQGPFYFFMMDKKAEWMAEGRWDETKGMKKLAEECKPLWAMLKTNQLLLEPYIKKVSEAKSRERAGDLSCVWDSSGRSLADIRKEARRVRERLENMSQDIRDTIARAGHNIKNKRFFVIHFNYLCKTDKDFYIPCEAAAVQFSVEEGVIKTWHKFISPLDSIPIGYKFRCLQHARNTHFLTPDFDQYEQDMKGILESLLEFLDCDEDDIPPLYVVPDHLEAADCILDFILTKAESELKPKVYLLTKLLSELADFPSDVIAEALMEDKTKNSHCRGLGCDLHETLSNASHCSLSIAQRWVFNFTRPCCHHFNLPLKSGKHFPQEKIVLMHPGKIKYEFLAIEERINRKIPTPAGVTNIPQGLDEEADKMVAGMLKEDEKRRAVIRAKQKELEREFPAIDIREFPRGPIPSTRPTLVKSGKAVIINR